ncbi:MAG: extracellular solute-binding protein [Acutalibacter sp.]
MHRLRKGAALLLAALLTVGMLTACSGGQEEVSSQVEDPDQLVLENDGTPTELVVAEISYSEERTQALEEIAEKYMADFPETEISIVTVDSGEEAQALLEKGGADLVELTQQELPGCVEQGLLLDLQEDLDLWEERSSLTAPAKQVLDAMGTQWDYLMPAILNQDLVYYRSDWFEEYNEGLDEGLVYCRIWEDFPDAAQKLAEKGAAGLVFGGKEHLVDMFDSMLWSSVVLGRISDPAAAYFSKVDENDTVFTLEQAANAVDQFQELIQGAVPQESLDWTEDQAVEAFTQGKAVALLAGQDRMDEISSSMEEGTWDVAAYPRGIAGQAITGLEYTGFGVAATSENPGNAIHFLTYLSNRDNNTHLASVCGIPPIHTVAADLEPSLEETPLAVNLLMVRRADWYYYAQEPVMYQAMDGWRQEADASLREYLAGERSKDQLLDGFAEYWSQALEQEGELWHLDTAASAE